MCSKKYFVLIITIALMTIASDSYAEDAGRFYAKLYGGLSFLTDKDFDQTDVASPGASGDSSYSTGWMAGGAGGYYISNSFSAELAWDYRTNDNDEVRFSDGTSFSDGDFSSSIFFLNGYYHFDTIGTTKFKPYVGLGLGYVEEIDLDLEAGGVETSYSEDGEFAYQFILGTSYGLTDNWDLTADARYLRVDGIDLKQESGSGRLKDVDYDPITVTFGAAYKF